MAYEKPRKEYPQRLYPAGKSPLQNRSMHHNCGFSGFGELQSVVGKTVYNDIMNNSQVGVILKLAVGLFQFADTMDPNDPNGYEEKKMRKHIQMLELWDDGDCGIMRWCPCGEPLTEEVIEGTRYYTCGLYKYDSFFHVRKRWDKAIGEEVVKLKEENAEQAKKICDLGIQLEKSKNEIAQLWDTVRHN